MIPPVLPPNVDSLPPVPPPVSPPVAPPTSGECVIELASECVISGNSSYAGQSCDVPILGVEPCLQRPYAATLLFNGGDCSQSDNGQELKFTCEDYNGGPPVNEGDEVYIIVTDIKGIGITYFEGIVGVGDTLPLNDDNQQFEADMFVKIYTPDQSTQLQMVQFHTSCSRNLELKNRFGSVQLVEFINFRQGIVSCFTDFSFALEITVPITAVGEDVMITSLVAMTNFAGVIDLTDQVVGQPPIEPGGSLIVTLEGTIDASERMTYTIMYSIQGVRVSDGTMCTGMETVSFEAGRDESLPVPTAPAPTAPVPAPSGGGLPTPVVPPVTPPASSPPIAPPVTASSPPIAPPVTASSPPIAPPVSPSPPTSPTSKNGKGGMGGMNRRKL